MQLRRLLQLALTLAMALPATRAAAQRGVDDELFKPALDPYGILSTERVRGARAGEFGFQSFVDYANRPLQLNFVQPGPTGPGRSVRRTVVDWAATLTLGASFGLTDRVELALAAPITRQSLNPNGYGQMFDVAAGGGPSGFFQVNQRSNLGPPETAPGDLRWGAKVNLVQSGGIGLAALLGGTLPFGDETQFTGSRSATP
jgi:hypothetical protein